MELSEDESEHELDNKTALRTDMETKPLDAEGGDGLMASEKHPHAEDLDESEHQRLLASDSDPVVGAKESHHLSTATSATRSTFRLKYSAFIIPLLFLLALCTFYFTSLLPRQRDSFGHPAVSNGTHTFGPTVLIISLDGVRASYLEEGLTPHLLQLSRKGLRAQYLQSVFPTLTFPNHWAMQTGLYAESHGIMANDFWDPFDDTEFLYTDSSKSWQPKWWLGEPMWETVVKNGLKSAVLMWPGPPQMRSGVKPTYFVPFENAVPWQRKTDQIAHWLDLPDADRPQLIAAYLPEVDQQGHATGPASDEVRDKLRYVDDFAKSIADVLQERNLTTVVDVLFVSDHGMTQTANERLVYLDEVLGEDGFAGIAHKEGWPSCGLRFKDGIDVALMVDRMQQAAQASEGGFRYYNHDTMPSQWHFSGSSRIAPHWLVPEVGWAITDKTEFSYMNQSYTPLGNHGYNISHPDMHAFFVAHGPFATRLIARQKAKRGSEQTEVIAGFANTEIYNLVTSKLLLLRHTAPNNGTVGFWDQYID